MTHVQPQHSEPPAESFDSTNDFLVTEKNGRIGTVLPIRQPLTKRQAQALGTWLVAFGFDFDAEAAHRALLAVLNR